MTSQTQRPSKAKVNFWWPHIYSIDIARQVAYQGVGAAIFVSVITTIVILVAIASGPIDGLPPLTAWGFIDVGLFVAIAIGLHKMSRVAAVSGFLLYTGGQLYNWSHTGVSGNAWLSFWLMLTFFNSIRASFTYHRLRQARFEQSVSQQE